MEGQRCWARKLRNVAAKLPRKHQDACLASAKGIYLSKTQREAVDKFRTWAGESRAVAPNKVNCIEEDLDNY